MVSLAHISDLHLPFHYRPSLQQLLGKRFLGYCNWRFNRHHALSNNVADEMMAEICAKTPSRIAITGDIVNLALEEEFKAAKNWLEKWAKKTPLSLTLGNHDAYVKAALNMAGDYFSSFLQGNRYLCDDNQLFPFYIIENNVAIVSISSAIATPYFCAFGYVSTQQCKILQKILQETAKQNCFRIVLIHHPPVKGATSSLKRLYGLDKLQRLFAQEGAELILHGHTHLPTISFIAGSKQPIPVIGISAASQAFGGKRPPAGYNWFEISKQQGSWHCHWTRYGLQQKGNFKAISQTKLYPLS